MKSNTKNKNSMKISEERLSRFTSLFQQKTGRKLSRAEALQKAEILLRTISILYRPMTLDHYRSAMIKKLIIRKFKNNY